MKGRHIHGERDPKAKLTEEDAKAIIACKATTWKEFVALAKKYGTTPENMFMISTGQSWKHLPR